MQKNEVVDITIIGGGPAGMFTAFYAGMRQASVKIIESLPQLGGQLSALYPEKYIYDIAGFPKVRAQELIDNLQEQMDLFKDQTELCLGQSVQHIEKVNGVFTIHTETGIHLSKSIIITAGNGAFQPRKLPIEIPENLEEINVHYFINDLSKFSNRKVVVFGGGDSAVDWALMLEPIAEKVTLVHRRDKFRAHEHSVDLLEKSKVEILTPYVPVSLEGKDTLDKVILKEAKGDHELEIKADDVIVNYGFVSSLGPIKGWDLNIEGNSIVVNSKQETNIEGIYAAGDICTYEGKIKLIATGFGEAATAVSNAKVYIEPSAKVQPLHSTSLMEKKDKSLV
ncbi:NAD(P)/FAD-dependent oxidoreductase [Metabacillus halosaccharovorans]|uniref:NAD(P)/FAD-dependent oxidoreductase n=1 Tax=Metabacillus halosaccharovorans TaxID=930124 RepID=UPI001C1F4AFB|nr:NAD(P)/FAD-dependent oxidoreductase [Metabacillus halosaccharovorans]MBU7591134.1 NAD(P)/FAD-dependent oxidoreductase [Metabacillus halosaccharovorans]